MADLKTLFGIRSTVLAISIALNLFLAGGLVGVWIADRGEPVSQATAEYSLAEFIRDLPGGTQQQIASAIDQRREDVARRVTALTRARAEVATALGAEPHDPSRVQRALVGLRESTRDVQAVMHTIVSDVTKGLSSGDRARLAQSMFSTVRRAAEDRALLFEVPLL